MGFRKDVIEEFFAFWYPSHDLRSTNQGCAFACVLKKLDLLQQGAQVKRENTIAFFEANGAGNDICFKLGSFFTTVYMLSHLYNSIPIYLDNGIPSTVQNI